MKKILSLFTVLVLTLTSSAQVAFLLRKASIANLQEEADYSERAAATWFNTNYVEANPSKGALVSMTNVLSISPTDYKVLWINIDDNDSGALPEEFTSDVIYAIENYVKAGGNLLLTKRAARILCEIGRMTKSDGTTKYEPSEEWRDACRTFVNANMGTSANSARDASAHPIFNGVPLANETYGKYLLASAVANPDMGYIWTEMERQDGEQRTGNGDVAHLNEFQDGWKCQVLAVWGDVVDYCAPEIIEFYPDGAYTGSVITIGAAAYKWGSNNTNVANVQKLTENALNYLSHGGVEYGYVLPYALSEIYKPGGEDNTYRPDYNAAKWFYKEYIEKDKGRFIHRGEDIPAGMKVLWINNDRSTYTDVNSFYNDLGGSTFATKLSNWVKGGGNVFLSKQATRLAKDIGRCSASLDYRMNGWQGRNDNTRYMTADFYALKDANENRVGFDRHDHPVYKHLPPEAWVTHNEEGHGDVYCKWQLMDFTDANKRTDNNAIWENHWDGYASSVDLARATKFETDDTCRILGGYGHTTALDGAGFVEFLPTATYSGTVMALGLCTYQWGDNNSMVSRIENLTKGVLDYLYNGTDTYTRSVTSGNYGTICLPRASAATSGATFFRVLGKEMSGETPLGVYIEEVDALEAGKPYIFEASAEEISVTYTGPAVIAPDNSDESYGLIGSFYRTLIPDNVTESDFRCILKDNKIRKVNHSYVGANRAYFDLGTMREYDDSQPVMGRRRFMGIDRPSMPTDVENAEAVKIESRKVIENGQLFIIKNGVKYNAQGQIVK